MPVVRRIRNRGATITVESHAEILLMPGGQVHNWTNRFTGRIRAATIAEAPTNKRPRWGHYGKPLKSTIVSARPRFWGNGRDRQRVYGAVGSSAPHSYYVDQGTGVYAGNGPYEAKVLPPWQRGSASLYEATWRPGGPDGRRVAPVIIKGQKGQFFFDAGLKRAFQSMRMRGFQVPGDPKIGDAGNSVATGLANFLGNTPADAAFKASLAEWRTWRDEAWGKREGLGRGGGVGSKAHAKAIREIGNKRRAKSNVRALAASRVAADRRAKAQAKKIRAMQEAKALGKKRDAERRAYVEREANKRAARTKGIAFGKAQLGKGATNLSGSWVLDPKTGYPSGFRVSWVSKNGKPHSRIFHL